MVLGRSVVLDEDPLDENDAPTVAEVNTRVSLWQTRWPAIALQACIDKVEEAPPELRPEIKRELPCKTCEKNTACLNAKRKELGPILYDRELLTSARSDESSLFPRRLMRPMLDPARGCLPHYFKPNGLEHRLVVVSAWDLAWSEKVGGDFLVKISGELDLHTGRKRVLDIHRWEGKTFAEQCELIAQQWALFHDDFVVIEADAAQVIWAQTVEAYSDVPVLRHRAGEEKQSLHIGVPALLIDFSARRWSFPYRTNGTRVGEIENLLIELAAFGYVDGKLQGVGEHDDTVMALWHLWYGLRMAGGGMSEFRAAVTSGRTQ
jgi:hypothetical protein